MPKSALLKALAAKTGAGVSGWSICVVSGCDECQLRRNFLVKFIRDAHLHRPRLARRRASTSTQASCKQLLFSDDTIQDSRLASVPHAAFAEGGSLSMLVVVVRVGCDKVRLFTLYSRSRLVAGWVAAWCWAAPIGRHSRCGITAKNERPTPVNQPQPCRDTALQQISRTPRRHFAIVAMPLFALLHQHNT